MTIFSEKHETESATECLNLQESRSGSKENELPNSEELQFDFVEAISQKLPASELEYFTKRGLVNKQVRNGMCPLHYAVDANYVEGISLLLTNGALVNVADETGCTPLLLCAARGYFKAMQVLIEHGAIVNYCDPEDGQDVPNNLRQMGYLTYDPLNVAIEHNNVHCVKLLLDSGAKPTKKYYMGYEINLTPIQNLSCLELLLVYGADPNVFSRFGMTPLMKACKENVIEAVQLLLKFGADVNLSNQDSVHHRTALNLAIEYASFEIVELLLQNGTRITKGNSCDYSPLQRAVLNGRPDVCRLLLSFGAKVDELSDDGCTALLIAAKSSGNVEQKRIIEILLQDGADPNFLPCQTVSSEYFSPVVEYIKYCPRNIIDRTTIHIFFKYGARINLQSHMTCGEIDPFGILPFLPELCDTETLEWLASVTRRIDKCSILSSNLQTKQRECLLKHALSPRPLKQLVRLFFVENLKSPYTNNVTFLPLPTILGKYLLFES